MYYHSTDRILKDSALPELPLMGQGGQRGLISRALSELPLRIHGAERAKGATDCSPFSDPPENPWGGEGTGGSLLEHFLSSP